MHRSSTWQQKAERNWKAYEDLPDPRSIRLLRREQAASSTRYVLRTFCLDRVVPFVALSYTWDNPVLSSPNTATVSGEENSDRTISCNGVSIDIRPNLADFLYLEQTRSPEWMWIDAICINQFDLRERQIQVELMGDIFSAAQNVIVWLGASYLWLPELLYTLENFMPPLSRLMEADGNDIILGDLRSNWPRLRDMGLDSTIKLTERALNGSNKFFASRAWFYRLWVIQEVALAQRIEVLCARSTLAWDVLVSLAKLLDSELWAQRRPVVDQKSSLHCAAWSSPSDFVHQKRVLRDLIIREPGGPSRLDLHNKYISCLLRGRHAGSKKNRSSYRLAFTSENFGFLWRPRGRIIPESAKDVWLAVAFLAFQISRQCRASDPRDKVYGMLGILNLGLPRGAPSPILSDYQKSEEAVYIDFVSLLINPFPLGTLSLVEDPSYRGLVGTRLPSWVPGSSSYARSPLGMDHLGSKLFNAVSGWTGKILGYTVHGQTLHVQGTIFDTVERVCAPFNDFQAKPLSPGVSSIPESRSVYKEDYLEETLQFCNLLPENYPFTTEPRLQALARTCAAGRIPDVPHTLSQLTESFHIFFFIVAMHSPKLRLETDGMAAREHFKRNEVLFEKLFAQSTSTRVPSSASLMDPRSYPLIDCDKETQRRFRSYMSLAGRLGKQRRLLVTSKGYLALGTSSSKAGDFVCLLENCESPFVLRSSGLKYRLIGEAYVHGAMNGEALTPEVCSQIESMIIE